MKKILVTGGAGFVGSHLVEKLIKLGNHVTVIDNCSTGRYENISFINSKNLRFYKKDISQFDQIHKHFKKIDTVFHLAALADIVPSIDNPKKYFDSNVTGTINVLNACVKYKIKKILYSASSSCYGIPEKYPTNENSKIQPRYPYALTKYQGEELLLHWGNVYGIKTVSLRLFNVYGPRSRTSGTYGAMFGVFLAQKLKNKPFTVVGNGKQKRDFTYVSDVVEAFLRAAKSNISGIYNVGSGNSISVNKIIDLLSEGKKIRRVKLPVRPGEPDQTFADIKKITKHLKWRPKINIELGVKILIKNINYWDKAPVWTKISINKATKNWFRYIK